MVIKDIKCVKWDQTRYLFS